MNFNNVIIISKIYRQRFLLYSLHNTLDRKKNFLMFPLIRALVQRVFCILLEKRLWLNYKLKTRGSFQATVNSKI